MAGRPYGLEPVQKLLLEVAGSKEAAGGGFPVTGEVPVGSGALPLPYFFKSVKWRQGWVIMECLQALDGEMKVELGVVEGFFFTES